LLQKLLTGTYNLRIFVDTPHNLFHRQIVECLGNFVLIHLTVLVELLFIIILLHIQCVNLSHLYFCAFTRFIRHILGYVEGLILMRAWLGILQFRCWAVHPGSLHRRY